MHFFRLNHRHLAAYGVGSGNAPALLLLIGVGHLKAAFSFNFLNNKYYEQIC